MGIGPARARAQVRARRCCRLRCGRTFHLIVGQQAYGRPRRMRHAGQQRAAVRTRRQREGGERDCQHLDCPTEKSVTHEMSRLRRGEYTDLFTIGCSALRLL